VNMRNYYSPLLAMFASAVAERFMDAPSAHLWEVVSTPDEVVPALAAALRSQP
jgi:predicted Rossmann-fold nucleotide-binding protein